MSSDKIVVPVCCIPVTITRNPLGGSLLSLSDDTDVEGAAFCSLLVFSDDNEVEGLPAFKCA